MYISRCGRNSGDFDDINKILDSLGEDPYYDRLHSELNIINFNYLHEPAPKYPRVDRRATIQIWECEATQIDDRMHRKIESLSRPVWLTLCVSNDHFPNLVHFLSLNMKNLSYLCLDIRDNVEECHITKLAAVIPNLSFLRILELRLQKIFPALAF